VPPAPVKHAAAARTARASDKVTRSAKPAEVAAAPNPMTAATDTTPPVAPMAEAALPAAAAPATATPVPVAETASMQTTHLDADETLPIAAGIGVGVIALGGAAFALRRRRRERTVRQRFEPPRRAAPPAAERDRVAAAPRAATPAAATAAPAGPAKLPNGFDLSQFGRHTRQAYLGPTPDNPSHSLKRRLKRASFFDQREREAIKAGAPAPQPVAAKAVEAEKDNGQVTVRLVPPRQTISFGYVLR